MIDKFVEVWENNKSDLREKYTEDLPGSYRSVVEDVIQLISDGDVGRRGPDPNRITEVDEGHYQGTKVFVIGEEGYQPSTYFYVRCSYGSCSHCDALLAIKRKEDREEQVDGVMRMALHVVQSLHKMDQDSRV